MKDQPAGGFLLAKDLDSAAPMRLYSISTFCKAKRKGSLMDAKIAINVEFLRARLLSERIVSRTARQRSEMLSQRVMELEEQLRIVNIQRKKAEKAAEEVVSILETQGIACIHGLTDSSTDQEDNQQIYKEGNPCILSKDIKEDAFLTPPGLNRSRVDDDLSRSDIDGPHSEFNHLSWRSHDNSLDSLEMQKTKQSRHRHNNNFIINVKSSERHPGKSCCKIKKHYPGSASENELEKSPLPDDGDGGVSHSDDFTENHECLVEASESKMDKFSVDSSIVRRNKESKGVYRKDDGMERALKQQAQFIIQFQAMENVQREWEEKINETKMSLLENPEPCNQVNKDENSIRSAKNSNLVGWIPEQEEDEKLSIKDISLTGEKKTEKCLNCEMASKRAAGETIALSVIETVPKTFALPPQERPDFTKKVHHGPIFEKPNERPVRWSSKEYYIQDNQNKLLELEHQYVTMSVNEAKQGIQGFTVPSQENPGSIYEKPSNIIPKNSTTNPPKQRILHTSLTEQRTPITKEKISTGGMLKERRTQQSSSSSLGSVLQSLQHARVSLSQELVKESSSGESTLAIPAPTNPPMKPTPTRKSLDFPIDSSSLFRLPSNSFSQVQLSGSNVYGSGLRLAATRPDLGFMASTVSAGKLSFNQSSSQPGFNVSVGNDYADRHPFYPYMDGMSKVQVRKEHANYYPTRFVESESPVSSAKSYFG